MKNTIACKHTMALGDNTRWNRKNYQCSFLMSSWIFGVPKGIHSSQNLNIGHCKNVWCKHFFKTVIASPSAYSQSLCYCIWKDCRHSIVLPLAQFASTQLIRNKYICQIYTFIICDLNLGCFPLCYTSAPQSKTQYLQIYYKADTSIWCQISHQ